MQKFEKILDEKAVQAGLKLNRLQLDRFTRYYELLIETNRELNLTALTEPEDIAVKHFIDSLLAYDNKLFHGKRLADVGTGAGFPGLPLKIYDPSIRLTLLDSMQKRLNFLRKVTEALELTGIEFIHARAEDAGRDKNLREMFDVVTARAVANLSTLGEYCLPLVKAGGYFVALKGSKYMEEIATANNALKILGGKLLETKLVHLPDRDDCRAILIILKNSRTSAAYPRKAGLPGKKPL